VPCNYFAFIIQRGNSTAALCDYVCVSRTSRGSASTLKAMIIFANCNFLGAAEIGKIIRWRRRISLLRALRRFSPRDSICETIPESSAAKFLQLKLRKFNL